MGAARMGSRPVVWNRHWYGTLVRSCHCQSSKQEKQDRLKQTRKTAHLLSGLHAECEGIRPFRLAGDGHDLRNKGRSGKPIPRSLSGQEVPCVVRPGF